MLLQTVFWAGMLFLSGITEIIILYLYLSHDGLKKGLISVLEITESLRAYYPIEICLQMLISVLFFISKDYLGLVMTLPMLLYNFKMIIAKDFECHAFFLEEYKSRYYIEKVSKYKAMFYGVLSVYTCFKFVESFVSFADDGIVT